MKFSKLSYFTTVFSLGVAVQIALHLNQVSPRRDIASDGVIASEYVDAKNNSIKVCWGDVDLMQASTNEDFVKNIKLEPVHDLINEKMKNLIREKINEQYNLQRVGIEFVGWKECQPGDNSKLRIFAFEKISENLGRYSPGQCEVAQSYTKYSQKHPRGIIVKRPMKIPNFMYLKMYDADPNKVQIFMRTAVHEFGHAAGLHHEQYQAEAANDPNCNALKKQDANFHVPFHDLGLMTSYGDYDPTSIMNSCFTLKEDDQKEQNIKDIKLSEGDVHSLRCTYLRSQLNAGETCIPRKVVPPEYIPPSDDEY